MLQHGYGNKPSDKVNAHDVGHKSYLAGTKVHKEKLSLQPRLLTLVDQGDLLAYFIKYIEQTGASTGSNTLMREVS